MIDIYCQVLLQSGGYMTNKHKLHLPRIELFLQSLSRKEPLYFEQRSLDEGEEAYATSRYKDYYYLVSPMLHIWTSQLIPPPFKQTKFGIMPSDVDAKRLLVKKYVEGLAWVLSYYQRGCISWTWYYPYLYAPLASDLHDLGGFHLKFQSGKPFTPLLQLLSVLPPQSSQFLPGPYEKLMIDSFSPLAKFYPCDFELDANGKKRTWESIPQIPFIDEELLLQSVSTVDHNTLSPKERARNRFGKEKHFFPSGKS